MSKFQIFYDYECPFCKRGYETLTELLPNYKGIEIEWRPVESHPRPEDHPPHTDLCVQSYYVAQELGADMKAFFAAMFQAVAAERQDVEKPEVLAAILKNVLDSPKFLAILKSGKYAPKVEENNDLAYEKKGVWYVPAFRALETASGGTLPVLDAKGGVGVNREEVREFLDKLTGK
ncbi:DsbA family oxidoreductase [Leadbettera azotonutricia]|uniref:Putative dsba oxidoreductase n=1 Tax=Leadbettera azotonutricia (strain ATCC BAA-888 / DSM 13862 / ZAS-9) TaxID=545695 RepID=F5YE43_LEAAZ|nr:DsbA family protein [Leadbettera azotonutricia]AEF80443.1 putative dsba oxidoreductase [Leadbettera azotonutricia ZAS-9]